MLTYADYASILKNRGKNLSQIRKNQADEIMNISFTGDIGYKRVYILDSENGWKYTDAKYIKHSNVSIEKDDVDTYLQFRPKEHYPIGTYVFIPNDTTFDLDDIDKTNPLSGNVSKLWMIVGRNDATQFARYMVLKINWNFKWVYGSGDKKNIYSIWGIARNANSYTSGIWNDQYVNSLNNVTSMWLPNTHYIYGDKGIMSYNIADTRLVTIQQRIMITLNTLYPNCYMVSKVIDMSPKGIIKLTLKQDDYDPSRDNANLLLCDYYNDTGDINIALPTSDSTETTSSTISYMVLNSDNQLDKNEEIPILQLGTTYYFSSEFSEEDIDGQWRVIVEGDYTEEERIAIEKLIILDTINSSTVSLRPGKSKKLKGLKFNLSVCDINGNYYSSLELEVAQ